MLSPIPTKWLVAIAFAAGLGVAIRGFAWIEDLAARAALHRARAAISAAALAPHDLPSFDLPAARPAVDPFAQLRVADASIQVDEESALLARLVVTALRRDGTRGLDVLPSATPAEMAGDPMRVRGKIVSVAGVVRESQPGDGFTAGRMSLADGRDLYFVTPLPFAPDDRTTRELRGVVIALRPTPTRAAVRLVVGAFVTSI